MTSSSVRPGDLSAKAFAGKLGELGWRGTFQHDDAAVVALREQLVAGVGC